MSSQVRPEPEDVDDDQCSVRSFSVMTADELCDLVVQPPAASHDGRRSTIGRSSLLFLKPDDLPGSIAPTSPSQASHDSDTASLSSEADFGNVMSAAQAMLCDEPAGAATVSTPPPRTARSATTSVAPTTTVTPPPADSPSGFSTSSESGSSTGDAIMYYGGKPPANTRSSSVVDNSPVSPPSVNRHAARHRAAARRAGDRLSGDDCSDDEKEGLPGHSRQDSSSAAKYNVHSNMYQHPKLTNVIEDALEYNKYRLTRAAICCPCYTCLRHKGRERVLTIINNSFYNGLQLLLTVIVLVADDLAAAFMSKAVDPWIEIMFGAAFVFFIVDNILTSATDRKQVFTLFWWLDLMAALSLLLEMPTLSKVILGSGSGGVSLVQAGKAARAGTRLGRFMRLIRIVRYVRIVKLFKTLKRYRVKPRCLMRRGEKSIGVGTTINRAGKVVRRKVGKGIRRLSGASTQSVYVLDGKVVKRARRKSALGPTGRGRPGLGATMNPDMFKQAVRRSSVGSTNSVDIHRAMDPRLRMTYAVGDSLNVTDDDTGMESDDQRSQASTAAGGVEAPSGQQNPPAPDKDDKYFEPSDSEEEAEDRIESEVGTTINSKIRLKVILGVILIFVVVPFLEHTVPNNEVLRGLEGVEAIKSVNTDAYSVLLSRFRATQPDIVYLNVAGEVLVDLPRNHRRELELFDVDTASSSVVIDISADRRQEAILSFVHTQVIIFLLAFQAVLLAKDVNKLLVHPIERISNHLRPVYGDAIRYLCDADSSQGWNVKFGMDDGEAMSTKLMLAAIESLRAKLDEEAKSAFRMRTVLGGLRRLSYEMGGAKQVFKEIRRTTRAAVPAVTQAVGMGSRRASAAALGAGTKAKLLPAQKSAAASQVNAAGDIPRAEMIAQLKASMRHIDIQRELDCPKRVGGGGGLVSQPP